MKFNLLKNKEKLKINTIKSNTNINEETREKFILKGWIESNRKPTCTNATRGFLFGSQTPSKMDFSLGRSMVEMLGVLAIIGVLSIGGISGYTIAMRRYKANEALNIMQKYALTTYTKVQNLMLNDPEHYFIDENTGEWLYRYREKYSYRITRSDFNTSGLGALPSGVSAIEVHSIDSVENSGDYVGLSVQFTDKELCKTISTIAVDSDRYSSCNYNNLRLFFMMN